jgi:predicted Rossmann fold flavoprotein
MTHTNNNKGETTWDVVVVGGGPAGMMAAAGAAKRGKNVLLLEKNTELGKKLLITGGGRCNVTNNKPDNRVMLAKYKGNDQFLFSAFSQFNVADTLSFFHEHNMPTKEENDGRMFPISNTAQSVYDVLYAYMKKYGVTIRKSSVVNNLSRNKDTGMITVHTKSGNDLQTKACIVATGGTSRPETGSTGEGFTWLKKLGHTIVQSDVALVPIALNDTWVKKVSGVVVQDVKLTTFQTYHEGNQKKLIKQESYKGKVLFAHFGISGPTVLNMSKDVGELIKYGEVVITLDLFPQVDVSTLRQRLQTVLVEESNKKIRNVLKHFVPAALVTTVLELAHIDGQTFCHSVRSEERIELTKVMKAIPLHVKGLLGKDKAVVSSGGVALPEVDFKTMESRIIPNLYLVGDVLNIDRPSGGYSLQLCWTTGFVAGEHC